MDEAFFLAPPRWLTNPPNPESTALFGKFSRSAPAGILPQRGTTVQGLYCMTPDGQFLSGSFACADKGRAIRAMEEGWRRWEQFARQRRVRTRPIPAGRPGDLTLGGAVEPGGLKLEVAVRDLPRGGDEQPGKGFFTGAFNLNWLVLTPAEVRAFVTESPGRVPVAAPVVRKLARLAFRDSVRGQYAGWREGAFRAGGLNTECTGRDGPVLQLRLSGSASLQEGGRAYRCELLGRAAYDRDARAFTAFELVASGQRSGRSQFNGRDRDAGTAPMGVALTLPSPTSLDPGAGGAGPGPGARLASETNPDPEPDLDSLIDPDPGPAPGGGLPPEVALGGDVPDVFEDPPLTFEDGVQGALGRGSFRRWTSSGGTFYIDAKWVADRGGKVVLQRRRDGRKVIVPVSRLSEADQAFLERTAEEANLPEPKSE